MFKEALLCNLSLSRRGKGKGKGKVIHNTKVKWSRHRPGVAQRVGRSIALLLHDRGTRRGWGVSSTPRPHFTPGRDPVPILHEAGCAPGPVWTDGKSRPHRDSIPDRPARSSFAIPTELPGPLSRRGIGVMFMTGNGEEFEFRKNRVFGSSKLSKWAVHETG